MLMLTAALLLLTAPLARASPCPPHYMHFPAGEGEAQCQRVQAVQCREGYLYESDGEGLGTCECRFRDAATASNCLPCPPNAVEDGMWCRCPDGGSFDADAGLCVAELSTCGAQPSLDAHRVFWFDAVSRYVSDACEPERGDDCDVGDYLVGVTKYYDRGSQLQNTDKSPCPPEGDGIDIVPIHGLL